MTASSFPTFHVFQQGFSSILKKIPLVITWHEIWGDYWYEYIGWKGLGGKTTERLVARLTSENIAVSKTTAKNLINLGIPYEIKIIPNGVDIKNIRSISPACEPSDIIFAGRLIREKHVDVLIQAFNILLPEHKDCILMIIGDGPELEYGVRPYKKFTSGRPGTFYRIPGNATMKSSLT